MWKELHNISHHHTKRIYNKAGKTARKKHQAVFDPKSPYVEQDIQDLLTQFRRYQLTKYRDELNKIIDDIKKKAAEDEEAGRTRKYEYMLKDEIRHLFRKYKTYNSELVAQWLNVKARNMGAVRAYRNAGYRLFKWVAQPDACPVCRTLHNKVIDISKGERFAYKGKMIVGFDPDTGQTARTEAFEDLFFPPAHPRCRCEVIPIDRSKAFADRVYAAIGTGIRDFRHAIEVGKIIHEEIDRRLGKTLIKQERLGYKKWNFLDALVRRFKHPRDREELRKMEDQLARYRRKRAEVALDVLREIRDFGFTPEIRQPFNPNAGTIWLSRTRSITSDQKNLVSRILHDVTGQYLPRAWLARSSKAGPIIPAQNNDYPSFYEPNTTVLNLNLKKKETHDPGFVLLHEMGHRMQWIWDDLDEIIRMYYMERTKYDSPEPLWLIASEEDPWWKKEDTLQKKMGRRDKFIHWLQMADGGEEILTTGLQSVFDYKDHRFQLSTEDPEYYRFILGLLAGF